MTEEKAEEKVRKIQYTRRNQRIVPDLEDEAGHEPRNVGRL